MSIGLFGFGTVGQGFYQIMAATGKAFEIGAIGVKTVGKPRPAGLPFTFDPDVILNDPSISVVVEAISDLDAGYFLVREALRRGKHVVSASKALLARHLLELHELANLNGVSLRYEAAVGGAIPVLDTLSRYLSHEPVTAVRGIVNGTTNYILTRMEREGLEFAEALADAQRLGFAELDPSADVDGLDAQNKLVLLSYHAFGQYVSLESIPTTGIRSIGRSDILAARAKGCAIKLVSEARLDPNTGKVSARVSPQVIAADDPLFAIAYERNAISIETLWSGPHLLSGRGAGALPTGTAVAFDVQHIHSVYSKRSSAYHPEVERAA